MLITFTDYEVQNAIYTIACINEGFKVDIKEDISEEDKNMREYYWDEVKKRGSVEYGLEKAISDYLLIQGEFDVDTGKYGHLVDAMGC